MRHWDSTPSILSRSSGLWHVSLPDSRAVPSRPVPPLAYAEVYEYGPISDAAVGMSYEAALCQVFDSIYMDVPMSRVKFNVNTEYAYLQNFKVLQNVFIRHQIDRPVPVENLIKCRMQDNLEFLQWTKKHWDQYYPGGEYDALARRKGAGPPAPASSRGPGTTSATGARRGGTTPVNSTGGRGRLGGSGVGGGANSAALTAEINAQKEAIAGLEKERDFYFAKLRDIELFLQQAVEADPELDKDDDSLVKHIQAILYSTEDGFEIPPEAEGVAAGEELETF
ncbi:microtubule-binding protein BIM1 [Paracoccidioides brasiliensis Pb18]|uniref:EB1 C-terminal domain-containing protein n=1 Tax=Paracoccidioides brasiliensis (strain Pb18) TaxID=502780 RepID=C1FYS5_PARBD|nr:microtubule-binding protein BIM1 [Paracoccidioides brasiliensis Pb18]EEH44662.2 hypothetical protein PADG_00951 [Paracoccidioides brasiliensis Pb18]